jgi:polar amino acid transport system substrate-binding protein
MINPKRLLFLWLLFIIILGSIVVSIDFASATSSQQPDSPSPPLPPSVIQQIRAQGVVTVGTDSDFPPFSFQDNQGNWSGFEIDLISETAKLWDVKVKFIPLTANDRLALLAGGEVQIIAASLTHSRDREAIIDFSQTYFLDRQRLLVRTDSGIEDFSDLAGRKVAVVQGTTGVLGIEAYARNKGIEIEVIEEQNDQAAVNQLVGQNVEAFTTDGIALSQFPKKYSELTVVGELWLVRKDSTITRIEDLQDKRVAAVQGATEILQIRDYARAKDIKFKTVTFGDNQSALNALVKGDVEAFTADGVMLGQFARAIPI